MDLIQIEAALSQQDEHELPSEALTAALANWPALYPEIKRVIGSFIENEDSVDLSKYSFIYYGFFLLLEKKQTDALDLIIDLMSKEEGWNTPLDLVFGDALTEFVPSAFYILAGGQSLPLIDYVLSSSAGMYCRTSAIACLFAQYESGILSESDFDQFIEQCFITFAVDGQSEVQLYLLESLAAFCLDYNLEKYQSRFIELANEGYLDSISMDIEVLEAWEYDSGKRQLESRQIISDINTVELLSGWQAFQKEVGPSDQFVPDFNDLKVQQDILGSATPEQLERAYKRLEHGAFYEDDATSDSTNPQGAMADSFTKVGRNDPCPCGSGKKFKKCCLH